MSRYYHRHVSSWLAVCLRSLWTSYSAEDRLKRTQWWGSEDSQCLVVRSRFSVGRSPRPRWFLRLLDFVFDSFACCQSSSADWFQLSQFRFDAILSRTVINSRNFIFIIVRIEISREYTSSQGIESDWSNFNWITTVFFNSLLDCFVRVTVNWWFWFISESLAVLWKAPSSSLPADIVSCFVAASSVNWEWKLIWETETWIGSTSLL